MPEIDWWWIGLSGVWGYAVSLVLGRDFSWSKWGVFYAFMFCAYYLGRLA